MVRPQGVIPIERVASRIYLIRGQKVMLDGDLAELYGTATKAFNQAVKRNAKRFPADFMFQLTSDEAAAIRSQSMTLNEPMRSQIVTASKRNVRYLPYAFTEQGVAMLSGVLNSDRAIEVNIAIMRAFVRLRQILASNRQLARKIEEHDEQIAALFDMLGKLLAPPDPPKKRPIGFITPRD